MRWLSGKDSCQEKLSLITGTGKDGRRKSAPKSYPLTHTHTLTHKTDRQADRQADRTRARLCGMPVLTASRRLK